MTPYRTSIRQALADTIAALPDMVPGRVQQDMSSPMNNTTSVWVNILTTEEEIENAALDVWTSGHVQRTYSYTIAIVAKSGLTNPVGKCEPLAALIEQAIMYDHSFADANGIDLIEYKGSSTYRQSEIQYAAAVINMEFKFTITSFRGISYNE